MSWFELLFGARESSGSARAWDETRAMFVYDASSGLLRAPSGETFEAGCFTTPTLDELRAAGRAALAASAPTGAFAGASTDAPRVPRVTFSHAATSDVLAMHARNPGATFLAASGLNALEFTARTGSPADGITRYEHDLTSITIHIRNAPASTGARVRARRGSWHSCAKLFREKHAVLTAQRS